MGYSRKEKHAGNCAKLCYISWKLQDQKPRPLETPHFFFVTPGNSTCYFCDSGIPGNSMSSTPTLFFFFSGIDQCKNSMFFFFFFHLILVGILSILILSVKNGQSMHKHDKRYLLKQFLSNCVCKTCYLHTGEYFRWLATYKLQCVQQLANLPNSEQN